MNLGGEQGRNTGDRLRKAFVAQALLPVLVAGLQNLSNPAARIGAVARSSDMAITRKLRMVFYSLATLELLVLSALYAWAGWGIRR
jgi:hypothetical protein